MELTVRGKNLEITEALHTYVEKHTGKIQRYFEKPIKINVLLRISNLTKTCEVTVFVDGVILRGVEKSDDMYKSIDFVFDKVERQIHKYKTRLAKKFKERHTLSKQFVMERKQSRQYLIPNLKLSKPSILISALCRLKKLFCR